MDVAKLAMLRFPVMSEKVKRLHLVDGTFELFRAHYTKRPGRQAPDGRPIKATYGVLTNFFALAHDAAEAMTHVAFAFDNVESFRNDMFAGYKQAMAWIQSCGAVRPDAGDRRGCHGVVHGDRS